MTNGINLLQGMMGEESARRDRYLRYTKIGSVLLLACYLLVIGATFSVWFSTQRDLKRTEEEIEAKKQKIAALQKIESLQILLKQRLSSLAIINKNKMPDYDILITYFTDIPSDRIIYKDFSLNDEGKMSLTGEAASSLVLADFLENVSKDSENLFSQKVLTTLIRQENGHYAFNLDLRVKGEDGLNEKEI